jgi:hypothetical protein
MQDVSFMPCKIVDMISDRYLHFIHETVQSTQPLKNFTSMELLQGINSVAPLFFYERVLFFSELQTIFLAYLDFYMIGKLNCISISRFT